MKAIQLLIGQECLLRGVRYKKLLWMVKSAKLKVIRDFTEFVGILEKQGKNFYQRWKMGKNRQSKLRPINIPASINIYDWIAESIKQGKTVDASLQGVDLEDHKSKVDQTLEHFNVKAEMRSKAGDALIRFALMMAIQDDGIGVSIPEGSPPGLHFIVDMWEFFNKLV